MIDFKARIEIAEWAGWKGPHVEGPPSAVWGGHPEDGCLNIVPEYEHSAADACSLLPKLAAALSDTALNSLRVSYLCADVSVALRKGADYQGRGVCRIIADAVRELKERNAPREEKA